jgi:hypothetical protein
MFPSVLGLGAAVLYLAGMSAPSSGACPGRFLGAWEYRQRAGQEYDEEGERIELTCVGGSLRGLYFGLEREGEHGLFYTLVEVPDLEVSPDGTLMFTVAERELFIHRPRSLQEVRQNRVTAAGFTKDTLHMQGGLSEGNLALTCLSKRGSCPEAVMVFHRGK